MSSRNAYFVSSSASICIIFMLTISIPFYLPLPQNQYLNYDSSLAKVDPSIHFCLSLDNIKSDPQFFSRLRDSSSHVKFSKRIVCCILKEENLYSKLFLKTYYILSIYITLLGKRKLLPAFSHPRMLFILTLEHD